MNQRLFEYTDYKDFLRDRISTYPNKGRGVRRQLAAALKCQNTYVSHVLSGDHHLSLEQGESAARFLGLSSDEAEYFLSLITLNRAGTVELRRMFEQILQKKRDEDLELKKRLRIKKTLSREDQSIYFSHWHFAVVHNALTVPSLRNPQAIAQRLKLKIATVRKVLDFLLSRGLVTEAEGSFAPTGKEIHFERQSPLIAQLHRNFRLLAMRSLEEESPSDLHYSAVVSCSAADLVLIRKKLTRALEECADVVRASPEEEIVSISLDWFVV